jgi:hypothetical protein
MHTNTPIERIILSLFLFLFAAVNLFGQAINMTTNASVPVTTTTCSATFNDDGGSGNVYTSTPGTYTQTFCPLTTSSGIRLFISSLDLRQTGLATNDDELLIYLGTSASGTLLYSSPVDVQTSNLEFYSNSGQCITIVFIQKGVNSGSAAGWSATVNCVTLSSITQIGATVNACSGAFVDPGGIAGYYGSSSTSNPTGYYSHNQSQIYTFSPSTPGSYVTLNFIEFNLDLGDKLIIIDGTATNAGILGQYTGTTLPPSFTASSSDGSLKVIFMSDNAISAPGWIAQLSCSANQGSAIPICSSANCSGSCGYTICSSGAFPVNAGSGPGVQEGISAERMGCLGVNGEINSTWYYFKAGISGTLGFVIDPPAGLDFDFALYGPGNGSIVCPLNTGSAPIRCSYADNNISTVQGNVGLVDGSGDLTEGSSGDGFVEDLEVSAGEEYALLINSYSSGNPQAAPTITWTGSAMSGLICGFALAGDIVKFDGFHNEGMNHLHWQTASEHNTDYFTLKKSRDGHDWETIANIRAAGSSSTLLRYQLADELSEGFMYYDLFLTDLDGKQTHIKTIAINADFCSSSLISSYSPNPTTGNVHFQYCGSNFDDDLQFTVYDSYGALVFEAIHQDFKDVSTISLNLGHLENGIYYATIYQNGVSQTKRLSIVK